MVIYKEAVPFSFSPYCPVQHPTPAHGGGYSHCGSHAAEWLLASPLAQRLQPALPLAAIEIYIITIVNQNTSLCHRTFFPYRLCDMLGVCAVVNLQHLCFGLQHLEIYENISCSTKGLFSKGYCSCTHTCTLYDYLLLFSMYERRKPKFYHVWKRREKLLYSLE